MNFRKEKDLLGEFDVPKDAYWGINTQRAIKPRNNVKQNRTSESQGNSKINQPAGPCREPRYVNCIMP